MSKPKIYISLLLIIVLSALLSGCDLFGVNPADYCCFSGLLPLPIAFVNYSLLR